LTAMIPSDLRRQKAHKTNMLHAWQIYVTVVKQVFYIIDKSL
jgi:hypothetical protein